MNTKQAAERWNISNNEVTKYCRKGFVEGANKVGGHWNIPTNAARPYYFEPKKAESQLGRKALILRAISFERVIPSDKLSQNPGRVEVLFTELINQGLIMRVQGENNAISIFRDHILTREGEIFLAENKTYMRIIGALPQLALNIHFHQ